MADVDVLGAGFDGGLFAEKHHSVVVVEDSRGSGMYNGGWDMFHGEDEKKLSKPQEVLGTVSHGHIFGLGSQERNTALTRTVPTHCGPA